jgi:hypothetical protein
LRRPPTTLTRARFNTLVDDRQEATRCTGSVACVCDGGLPG